MFGIMQNCRTRTNVVLREQNVTTHERVNTLQKYVEKKDYFLASSSKTLHHHFKRSSQKTKFRNENGARIFLHVFKSALLNFFLTPFLKPLRKRNQEKSSLHEELCCIVQSLRLFFNRREMP